MKLKVVQLNFGYGGGSASAYIYGPAPTDVFAPHPHLAIHISFTLHRDRPDVVCTTQDLVILPIDTATPFLCVGFLSAAPMHADRDLSWPHPSEYRDRLTQAIAKMVSVALQTSDADYHG